MYPTAYAGADVVGRRGLGPNLPSYLHPAAARLTPMAHPNYLPAHHHAQASYPSALTMPDSRTSSEQPISAQPHTHSQSPDVDVASPTSSTRMATGHSAMPLSADQPPTTQGKARTRVYVACCQWSVPVTPCRPQSRLFSSKAELTNLN